MSRVLQISASVDRFFADIREIERLTGIDAGVTAREPDLIEDIARLGTAESDAALRAIAGRLRGTEFGALAGLLDPDAPGDVKLGVKRARRGKPPPPKDLELEEYMIMQVDVFGEHVESTIAAARGRYGVTRSACTNALREAREIAEAHPYWIEALREIAPGIRAVATDRERFWRYLPPA